MRKAFVTLLFALFLLCFFFFLSTCWVFGLLLSIYYYDLYVNCGGKKLQESFVCVFVCVVGVCVSPSVKLLSKGLNEADFLISMPSKLCKQRML